MAPDITVRRTRLQDVQIIAAFVNRARPRKEIIDRLMVAQRFSDVGFLIAEHNGQLVGLMGWQVENLVSRVTDFLIAPAVDRVIAGKALIEVMEKEALLLQAEAVILFLPPNPSDELIDFWEMFDYTRHPVTELTKNWREATQEWDPHASEVMIKKLREGLTRRPM